MLIAFSDENNKPFLVQPLHIAEDPDDNDKTVILYKNGEDEAMRAHVPLPFNFILQDFNDAAAKQKPCVNLTNDAVHINRYNSLRDPRVNTQHESLTGRRNC